jgi:predicted  nucleic acid-binding Zn-ribbon protein
LGILRSQRDQLKDSIDHKLKERTQHSKLLKKAEDEDHNMDEEIVNLLNNLKKVENQVLGYEAENEKLRKMIAQL